MAPAPGTSARRAPLAAVARCAIAAALLVAPANAQARHRHHAARALNPVVKTRHLHPVWPVQLPDAQYLPVSWDQLAGWDADDHLAAFKAFRAGCRSAPVKANAIDPAKPLDGWLAFPCRAARMAHITDDAAARAFFEQQFVPLQIARLGQDQGFVTGYYEPVLDGSKERTDDYTVPVLRRPSNLFVRGYHQGDALPNGGQVFRKIGRRKLVPYYDRAEIEDGKLARRGLEICWLKSQTDLLFAQIQGSARINLGDGSVIRLNYDAHNGYPYTPVGRVLIERGLIPREQMSMQRIRQWMEANPDGAGEVRRANRSYVFFREVALKDGDEAVGAQGLPLTPGRSIAVDKGLHVYGTPFFIAGELPIESVSAKTPFHRLMIAQDTGSAITGPARADLFFGAGQEAGAVAGRIKHPALFTMLVPRGLDPVANGHTMPLPDPRPSAQPAKPTSAVANTAPAATDGSPHHGRHGRTRHHYRRHYWGR